MNSNRPEVSIVIPVFNAKETLKILTARIKAAMDLQKRSFELILVNDGSSDSSWDQIQELAREYAFVRASTSCEIMASITPCYAAFEKLSLISS